MECFGEDVNRMVCGWLGGGWWSGIGLDWEGGMGLGAMGAMLSWA